MKKIKILIVIAIGIVFVSCQSNTYEEITGTENPTYTKNIAPLVQANCISCHNNTPSTLSVSLETYSDVKFYIQSGTLLCRIENVCGAAGVMPPTGKMPQTSIDLIKKWVANGYQN